jgi:hypothetical protein
LSAPTASKTATVRFESRIERVPLSNGFARWLRDWSELREQGWDVTVLIGEGSAVGLALSEGVEHRDSDVGATPRSRTPGDVAAPSESAHPQLSLLATPALGRSGEA